MYLTNTTLSLKPQLVRTHNLPIILKQPICDYVVMIGFCSTGSELQK